MLPTVGCVVKRDIMNNHFIHGYYKSLLGPSCCHDFLNDPLVDVVRQV